MRKILYIVNVDWFFISHRLTLAVAAKNQGFHVFVACKDTGKANIITEHSLNFLNLDIDRSSMNPFKELKAFFQVLRLIKNIKPNIIHNVTLKPMIYGSLAGRIFKIPKIINAVSGMGYNFTNNNRSLIEEILFFKLIKLAFNSKKIFVIFQNPDNLEQYVQRKIIDLNRSTLIKGSGVNLRQYSYEAQSSGDVIKILFSGRLLIEKGIREFISAARTISSRLPNNTQFIVAGRIDTESKTSIEEKILFDEAQNGHINYLGFIDNMIELLRKVDIVVLPSYYGEGVPKSLIEAAAIGRPIITTDMPGCRETVIDGINGYLVPPMNSNILAERIEILVKNEELRIQFGKASRSLAEKEFSIDKVIEQTITLYQD